MAGTKTTTRSIWALGDYHRFATETVWELGPVLVKASGIAAGQRVLDVAAGTGNVAIRAAATGAAVVASDLTPEHFPAGRRAATRAGVDLQWVEGDAQALPFSDSEFDVVTSCFGAMFALDHHATAHELLRVCRPGGVIGMMNFTPDGAGGDFFRLLSPYLPPLPADAAPPLAWGIEDHVRGLFADKVDTLALTRHEYAESAATARDYFELFRTTFGPVVAIVDALKQQAGGVQDFKSAFLEFIAKWNQATDGSVRIPYEYLLIVARKHHG